MSNADAIAAARLDYNCTETFIDGSAIFINYNQQVQGGISLLKSSRCRGWWINKKYVKKLINRCVVIIRI